MPQSQSYVKAIRWSRHVDTQYRWYVLIMICNKSGVPAGHWKAPHAQRNPFVASWLQGTWQDNSLQEPQAGGINARRVYYVSHQRVTLVWVRSTVSIIWSKNISSYPIYNTKHNKWRQVMTTRTGLQSVRWEIMWRQSIVLRHLIRQQMCYD